MESPTAIPQKPLRVSYIGKIPFIFIIHTLECSIRAEKVSRLSLYGILRRAEKCVSAYCIPFYVGKELLNVIFMSEGKNDKNFKIKVF